MDGLRLWQIAQCHRGVLKSCFSLYLCNVRQGLILHCAPSSATLNAILCNPLNSIMGQGLRNKLEQAYFCVFHPSRLISGWPVWGKAKPLSLMEGFWGSSHFLSLQPSRSYKNLSGGMLNQLLLPWLNLALSRSAFFKEESQKLVPPC